MTELKFVDLDLFEAVAEQRVRVQEERFVVQDLAGAKLAITPGLSLHRELTVLGADWIPVRADGVTTLQQMTHTPHLFLGKARNVVEQDGRWFAQPKTRRRLEAPALVVGGTPNYYHWLVDNVPRLLLARKYGQLAGRQVLVNHDLTGFAADTLRLVGVRDGDVVRVEPDAALTLADACVPTYLAQVTLVHPAVPRLVREALPVPAGGGGKRRLYLCRQDAPTRQLVNEAAFAQLLARHGFERLLPSQMTLQQQMAACADAEAIIAVHGAALANMLFARPGTQVLELYSPAHKPGFFALLARVCGHRHRYVPTSLVDPRPDVSPLHHQWQADLGATEAALREILPS